MSTITYLITYLFIYNRHAWLNGFQLRVRIRVKVRVNVVRASYNFSCVNSWLTGRHFRESSRTM